MKSLFTIFLAAMFGTGCYTQVRSSGDYWGYTGHHQREKVQVVPNQADSLAVQDTSAYTDDQRGRDDDGYSSGDVYYDDGYYNAPNWAYYNAPYASFSFGFGWHRPWWNLGYNSYYPYCGTYDPYWDWYYQPGFFSYGCIAPIYPFYYGSFYRPYYGSYFGRFHDGFFTHERLSNSGIRSGRITSGEGRANTARAGVLNSTAPSSTGRTSIGPRSSVANNSQPARAGATQSFNTPRNNPRLVPQGNYNTARVPQRLAQRSYRSGGSMRAPRQSAYGGNSARSGGGYHSSGGGSYRGGGGGGRSSGGSARSGGGGRAR